MTANANECWARARQIEGGAFAVEAGGGSMELDALAWLPQITPHPHMHMF